VKTTRRALSVRAAAATAAACLGLLAAGPVAAQGVLEFPVKAAFLTKFAAFVSWPAGAAPSSEPLQLCIVGADPFGVALDQSAQAAAGERPITVRRLAVVDRDSGCHIVYAAGSPRQSAAEALQAVGGAPVLTVTDSAHGPARGAIHFVVFQNRVRFHIDAAQAAQNGISLSSKLLALGLSVKR
jgi:hypothetical protein